MAQKPRENRIPIMMSDAEVSAIDAWGDANKVATRSGSVRRLCHIGLAIDDTLEPFLRKLLDSQVLLDEASRALMQAGDEATDDADYDQKVTASGDQLMFRLGLAREMHNELTLSLLEMLVPLEALRPGGVDIDAALARAKSERAALVEMRRQYSGILPGETSIVAQAMVRRDAALHALTRADADADTVDEDLLDFFTQDLDPETIEESRVFLMSGNMPDAVRALGLEPPASWPNLVHAIRVLTGSLAEAQRADEGEVE